MSSTARVQQDYDANLLASAPQATKEQLQVCVQVFHDVPRANAAPLQSGYTTDLLKPKKKQSRRAKDVEDGLASPKKQSRPSATTESSPAPSKMAPPPFYRRKMGIIVIVIVAIVVLAAIIGGVVGGTKKKTHINSAGQVNGGNNGVPSGDIQPAPTVTSATSTTSEAANPIQSKESGNILASLQEFDLPV